MSKIRLSFQVHNGLTTIILLLLLSVINIFNVDFNSPGSPRECVIRNIPSQFYFSLSITYPVVSMLSVALYVFYKMAVTSRNTKRVTILFNSHRPKKLAIFLALFMAFAYILCFSSNIMGRIVTKRCESYRKPYIDHVTREIITGKAVYCIGKFLDRN